MREGGRKKKKRKKEESHHHLKEIDQPEIAGDQALDMADGCDEDFEEEEVWAVMTAEIKDAMMSTPKAKRVNHHKGSPPSTTGSSSGSRRIISSGARMIPIRSNASSEAESGTARRSAALSIPDCSKIHRHGKGRLGFESPENDDEDDGVRAPPHEWLAKKMARSQISSSSVCEGAGRTLKGRDLSKVRNAVLIRTGFLE